MGSIGSLAIAAAPYLIPLMIQAYNAFASKETNPDKKATYAAIARDLEMVNDKVQAVELPPEGSGRE